MAGRLMTWPAAPSPQHRWPVLAGSGMGVLLSLLHPYTGALRPSIRPRSPAARFGRLSSHVSTAERP